MPMQMHTVSAEGITQFQIIHFENSMMMFAAQKNVVDLRVLQGEISAEQGQAAIQLIERLNDPSLIGSKDVVNRLKEMDLSKVKIRFKGTLPNVKTRS